MSIFFLFIDSSSWRFAVSLSLTQSFKLKIFSEVRTENINPRFKLLDTKVTALSFAMKLFYFN